jgi:uncharacterized protein (UPF0262 family)
MPQSTGRNTTLENLWRTVTTWTGRIFSTNTGQTAPTFGQVFSSSDSVLGRDYDQEYREIPVRDPYRGRQLIELRKCPEVSTAIDILVGDTFSNEDGDDSGFTVADTLNDNKTLADAEVVRICRECISRAMSGTTLWSVVEDYLSYGDSFRSIILSKDLSQIERLKQLPTWEMFRVEDEHQTVERFEQRSNMSELNTTNQIHPVVCVHWRYRRRYKYGQSLFEEIIPEADRLVGGYFALDKAAMAIGINPNVHVLPNGWTEKQRQGYIDAHNAEKRKQGRIITDFYTLYGGDVKKLASNWNPDLKALLDNVLQNRNRIGMRSRVPPWMMGLPTIGARDIAGQPALAYARFVGAIRVVLIEGIRQILDLELALHGYEKNQMLYRLVFPTIYVNPHVQSANNEADTTGINDLDLEDSAPRIGSLPENRTPVFDATDS